MAYERQRKDICPSASARLEPSRHESAGATRTAFTPPAMLAAQRVTKEVLGTCQQQTLLALRRSVLPGTPIRSSRKLELIADIALECDTLANRQRIFAEVLGTWSMHELRLFIARLKGLGYMVPVAQRPRQQDLIAAIVNAGECIARAPMVSKRTSKTRKDICSSASAAAAAATVARAPAEQSGLRAEGTSQGSSAEGPVSAIEPSSCTALVALDSAAAPLQLQQRLSKRWRKKCAKFLKRQAKAEARQEIKKKLKRVKDEVRKAFQEHETTATVGELRAMVGHAVGVPLDGKYRLRFDRALDKLTGPAPKKHRAARRFTIPARRLTMARSSRTESA